MTVIGAVFDTFHYQFVMVSEVFFFYSKPNYCALNDKFVCLFVCLFNCNNHLDHTNWS